MMHRGQTNSGRDISVTCWNLPSHSHSRRESFAWFYRGKPYSWRGVLHDKLERETRLRTSLLMLLWWARQTEHVRTGGLLWAEVEAYPPQRTTSSAGAHSHSFSGTSASGGTSTLTDIVLSGTSTGMRPPQIAGRLWSLVTTNVAVVLMMRQLKTRDKTKDIAHWLSENWFGAAEDEDKDQFVVLH